MSRVRGAAGLAAGIVAVIATLVPSPAEAIPAFARKYGTSCLTCHTVFPRLTPFGEAFRRNNYMFPGTDTDFVKQDTVPLGQEAYKQMFPNAVWPGTLPASIPMAAGFNGTAVIHPDKSAHAAVQDNGSIFTMNDLVAEGHLWFGGSFSENITFYGELTFGSDGSLDIEHANIHFNNLLGPKHALHFVVGRFFPTLTSYGTHSAYAADTIYPGIALTALYGSTTDSFAINNEYNGAEVNGMIKGRFIYSVGVNNGSNVDIRPSESVYAHVGFKIGGMRLDGEEGGAPGDPNKPWAENSISGDVFFWRSASRYTPAAAVTGTDAMGNPITTPRLDADETTWLVGGYSRLSLGSFALDAGAYNEWHRSGFISDAGDMMGGQAFAVFAEASYIVFPWLVPAFRFEWIRLQPDIGSSFGEWRIFPTVDFLIRPNLKFVLASQMEFSNNAAMNFSTWGPAGGFAPNIKANEVENITGTLAYAY